MKLKQISSLLDKIDGVGGVTDKNNLRYLFSRCTCKNNKDCKSFSFKIENTDGQLSLFMWVSDEIDLTYAQKSFSEISYSKVTLLQLVKKMVEEDLVEQQTNP